MSRIVLLGGGYVTLHAYATLVRRVGRAVRRGQIEIVVISADRAHRFHGFTGELIAGMVDRDRLATPLDEAMPLARIVDRPRRRDRPGRRRLVSYRVGEDRPSTRCATTTSSSARGPRSRRRTTRGMHAFAASRCAGPMRSAPSRITWPRCPARPSSSPEAASRASSSPRRSPIAAIRSRSCSSAPGCSANGTTSPRLVARAEAELARLGVTVLTGSPCGRGHAVRRPAVGRHRLACGTVVAATGQRPVRIPGLEGRRDERGRLRTRRTLAVTAGVWAAGDAARVVHPVTRHPVPANALWAIKGGDHIGRSIARELRGRRARRFGYRGLGTRRLVRPRQGDRGAVRASRSPARRHGCCGSCSSCGSCPRAAARPASSRTSPASSLRPHDERPVGPCSRGRAHAPAGVTAGLTPSGGTTRTSRRRRPRWR